MTRARAMTTARARIRVKARARVRVRVGVCHRWIDCSWSDRPTVSLVCVYLEGYISVEEISRASSNHTVGLACAHL